MISLVIFRQFYTLKTRQWLRSCWAWININSARSSYRISASTYHFDYLFDTEKFSVVFVFFTHKNPLCCLKFSLELCKGYATRGRQEHRWAGFWLNFYVSLMFASQMSTSYISLLSHPFNNLMVTKDFRCELMDSFDYLTTGRHRHAKCIFILSVFMLFW